MAASGSNRLSTQMVVGLFAVLLGVLFTLDNLGIMDAGEYLAYWPAVIVLVGLVKLFQPGTSGKVWGTVFVIIGGVLLLRSMDLFYIRFRDFWPLVLVLVGGSLLWGAFVRRKAPADGTIRDTILNGTAIMGGFQRSIASQDFRGGELTAVLGGCEIDLRQAVIRGDEAVINIFAFMGGVELRVPENWTVVMQGLPILGGFSDETRGDAGPGAKRLVITGTAIMGGAEVKN